VRANFDAETRRGFAVRLSPFSRLRAWIGEQKGAELRHFFTNKNRDLSLELWVEARAGIEPACKDLQSSA
jgi:hypothetical protein